jgi:hypothetical protein
MSAVQSELRRLMLQFGGAEGIYSSLKPVQTIWIPMQSIKKGGQPHHHVGAVFA